MPPLRATLDDRFGGPLISPTVPKPPPEAPQAAPKRQRTILDRQIRLLGWMALGGWVWAFGWLVAGAGVGIPLLGVVWSAGCLIALAASFGIRRWLRIIRQEMRRPEG